MSHEILEHDNVYLHKTPAWHGLGIVATEAEADTPTEAIKRLGMDYEIHPWSLTAHGPNGETIELDSHVCNVRSDVNYPLGVVSSGFDVFQNIQLAEFCEALAEQGDQVRVESVGSIRNGRKVWFLLKGESFSVREDQVIPYICVSNGHDGTASLRLTPTTIRVVCSNTLHMVIPRFETGGIISKISQAGCAFKHVGNLKERVEEAKQALQLYNKGLDDTRRVIDTVAAKEISSREDVQKFFLECYTTDFGAVASEPKNDKEAAKRQKAMDAFNQVGNRFDMEQKLVGPNYWAAFNAYTGWMQNDKITKNFKDLEAAKERRMHSKLFGLDATRSHHALQVALAS